MDLGLGAADSGVVKCRGYGCIAFVQRGKCMISPVRCDGLGFVRTEYIQIGEGVFGGLSHGFASHVLYTDLQITNRESGRGVSSLLIPNNEIPVGNKRPRQGLVKNAVCPEDLKSQQVFHPIYR